jgi:hypothetical protein
MAPSTMANACSEFCFKNSTLVTKMPALPTIALPGSKIIKTQQAFKPSGIWSAPSVKRAISLPKTEPYPSAKAIIWHSCQQVPTVLP